MSISKQDTRRKVVRELEAFEQELPSNIQQQLNVRRQQVLKNEPKRSFYLSAGLAASLALVLLVNQFTDMTKPIAPVVESQLVAVQPEMFEEDIQMLAQLEFVYWLSEQELDEAG